MFAQSYLQALHGVVQDRKGLLQNAEFTELRKFIRELEDLQYPKSFCFVQIEIISQNPQVWSWKTKKVNIWSISLFFVVITVCLEDTRVTKNVMLLLWDGSIDRHRYSALAYCLAPSDLAFPANYTLDLLGEAEQSPEPLEKQLWVDLAEKKRSSALGV
ncbi:hypothetical protein BTVI_109891 [Pitangus sulphuratus]|nr:hypothetical protein BTVI_109891 [Pitangus sulphuratus]